MSYQSTDFEKTINITCNNISAEDQNLLNLLTGLQSFNSVVSLASITCAANVYTYVTKDSRTFQYTLFPGGQFPTSATFNIVSTNNWSANEFAQINNMAHVFAVFELVYGMTALSIVYN
jgi:hypothetical protein